MTQTLPYDKAALDDVMDSLSSGHTVPTLCPSCVRNRSEGILLFRVGDYSAYINRELRIVRRVVLTCPKCPFGLTVDISDHGEAHIVPVRRDVSILGDGEV